MSKTNLAQIFPEPKGDEPHIKDGDGNEPPDENLTEVSIEIALNGYTVSYHYDNMDKLTYVFLTFDEVLEQLRSKH
jgi:hypothetical protein